MPRLEQYYANELQYLADAGKEFARQHPQEAALLDLSNVQSRDPHVERLFENFAFLTGSLRSKLEDEFPELVQSFLGLLCPQYVRPVPALAIVQLSPDFAQLTKKDTVQAGRTVKSEPVASAGQASRITCSFRTCFDVDLHSLELDSVALKGPTNGCHILELGFELRGAVKWDDVAVDRIRLYLAGETHQFVYSLYYHLCQRVRQVEISADKGGVTVKGSVRPVGFDRSEEVIPYPTHAFPGFRLLQEYFCFPQKFFCVDLCGVKGLPAANVGKRVTVRIQFDGEAPGWWSLTKEHFLGFCTPVINLGDEHAFPIDFDQRTTDYPIYVDKGALQAFQVFSVKSVTGRPVGDVSGATRVYPAFYEFRHDAAEDGAYYHAVSRVTPTGEDETVLSLFTSEDASTVLPEQVLNVDVECFNGDLPSALRPGMIRFRGDDMSQLVGKVRNLATPTPVRRPGRHSASSWHFVSHLALNHLSMSDVDSLAGILRLYEWTGDSANLRRIEGLRSVVVRKPDAVLVRRGNVLQGLEVELTLDPSYYTDLGDAYLFAMVLRHFLALYAAVNTFVRTRVKLVNSSEEWVCPALDGRLTTL